MPHMGHILHGRYAVVSCHVERPLDDDVWQRFGALQARRPGGFAIAALMRPPDAARRGRGALARARARGAVRAGRSGCTRTGPRPTTRVRRRAIRRRSCASKAAGSSRSASSHALLRRRLVHRRRAWPMRSRELGYADCTATAFRPDYLAPGAAHLQAGRARLARARERPAPARAADDALARHACARRARSVPRQVVHAYFHDTDLLDRTRRDGPARAG